MPLIIVTSRRPPFAHSSQAYSTYDRTISSDEFVVRSDIAGKVRLFFPVSGTTALGVGLNFPSTQVAVAVARALLSVAEGHLSEVTGKFGEQG